MFTVFLDYACDVWRWRLSKERWVLLVSLWGTKAENSLVTFSLIHMIRGMSLNNFSTSSSSVLIG